MHVCIPKRAQVQLNQSWRSFFPFLSYCYSSFVHLISENWISNLFFYCCDHICSNTINGRNSSRQATQQSTGQINNAKISIQLNSIRFSFVSICACIACIFGIKNWISEWEWMIRHKVLEQQQKTKESKHNWLESKRPVGMYKDSTV